MFLPDDWNLEGERGLRSIVFRTSYAVFLHCRCRLRGPARNNRRRCGTHQYIAQICRKVREHPLDHSSCIVCACNDADFKLLFHQLWTDWIFLRMVSDTHYCLWCGWIAMPIASLRSKQQGFSAPWAAEEDCPREELVRKRRLCSLRWDCFGNLFSKLVY